MNEKTACSNCSCPINYECDKFKLFFEGKYIIAEEYKYNLDYSCDYKEDEIEVKHLQTTQESKEKYMSFIAHTQEELKNLNIIAGNSYLIEYPNKDYYNGEENIEKGKATAIINGGNIYFNVIDPYGMDKLTMKARVLNN